MNAMMLKEFRYGDKPVRTVMMNGDVYFLGDEIATLLGYVNSRKALKDHVDSEDKNTVTIRDGIRGNPNKTVINESGLYSLVLSSKLPDAKKFKHWVTSEVLPSIRKYGLYATPEQLEKMMNDPDFAIRLFQEIKSEREKRIALEHKVAIMEPKASYYDVILNSPTLASVESIAKDYGMTAFQLNKILCDKGIQYRRGRIWFLYAKYAKLKYAQTYTFHRKCDGVDHAFLLTKWTQAGRRFIYDTLKADGIYPVCEQGREPAKGAIT